jgi:hypothetical protein
MRNPLTEYWVIENFGPTSYDPAAGGDMLGTLSYEGSTYRLLRTFSDEMIGENYQTYWAVREHKRTTGTVNMAVFFDAWRNLGLGIGNPDYQIFATDGYFGTGASNITVGEAPTSSISSISLTPTPSPVSKPLPPSCTELGIDTIYFMADLCRSLEPVRWRSLHWANNLLSGWGHLPNRKFLVRTVSSDAHYLYIVVDSAGHYRDIIVDMVAPYPDSYLDSAALKIKRIFDMSRGMAARLFLKRTRLI